MKNLANKLGVVGGVALLALQTSVAWAQAIPGTIVVAYAQAGQTTSVPTLSEWALIGLALALAGVAGYFLRGKGGAKPLASVIVATSLVLGGFAGNKLLSQAYAAVGWAPECSSWAACSMSNPVGGTVTTGPTGQIVTITNTSGVAQTVTAVTANAPAIIGAIFPASEQCTVGMVLQPGQFCKVVNGWLT